MHRTSNYRDRGSPCLSPWEGAKGSKVSPFQEIAKVVEIIQSMISFAYNSLIKPVQKRTWQRKSQCTWSYVFSKSTFEYEAASLTSAIPKGVDNLLNNGNVILSGMAGNEARLARTHESEHMRLKTVGKNLGDDLHQNVVMWRNM